MLQACWYKAINPFDQIGTALTIETYCQTYKHFVVPVNIENLDSTARIQPPEFKKQCRRPKSRESEIGMDAEVNLLQELQ